MKVMRIRRFAGVFGALAVVLQLSAFAPSANATWLHPKQTAVNAAQNQALPGVCVTSLGSSSNVDAVRTLFNTMGTTGGIKCGSLSDVESKVVYANAVNNGPSVNKTYLYSLTHGGLDSLNDFKALVLVHGYTGFLQDAERARQVWPVPNPVDQGVDIPSGLSYTFAIMSGCHVGDETPTTNAAALRQKFSATVYVSSNDSLGIADAQSFGTDFMQQLSTYQAAATPNNTIAYAFSQVAAGPRGHYTIKSGSASTIRAIFP